MRSQVAPTDVVHPRSGRNCLLEAEHGFFQTQGPKRPSMLNVGDLRIEDGDGAQVILKQLDFWSLAAFLQHRARPFAAVKVLDASDRRAARRSLRTAA